MIEPKTSTVAFGPECAEAPLDPAVVASLRRLGLRSGRNVLDELTGLFLTTADGQVHTAEQLLGRLGLPELARVAHALKGSASVIGGRRMAAAAAALETLCLSAVERAESAADSAAAVERGLEGSIRAALNAFRSELELFRRAVADLRDPS